VISIGIGDFNLFEAELSPLLVMILV